MTFKYMEDAWDEIQITELRLPKEKFFFSTNFLQLFLMTFKYMEDAWDEIQITEPRLPKGLQCEQFA